MEYNTKGKVLKKAVVWKELYFYRKSDAIYQLTVEFCHRFLPAHGDRTVDQMVQAARSGKQNITLTPATLLLGRRKALANNASGTSVIPITTTATMHLLSRR